MSQPVRASIHIRSCQLALAPHTRLFITDPILKIRTSKLVASARRHISSASPALVNHEYRRLSVGVCKFCSIDGQGRSNDSILRETVQALRKTVTDVTSCVQFFGHKERKVKSGKSRRPI